MSINLKGADELSEKMLKLMAKISDVTHAAAESWAKDVTDSAQRRAPKLTGELELRIHSEVNGGNASVISDAPNERGHSYAAYVELGTGHGPAQPYLYPAFTEHRDVSPQLRAALAEKGII